MAQHIPTKNFTQKAFRIIENGIDYAFHKSRGLMKTSSRFDYVGVQEGNEVYLTTRKIPAGIIYGGIDLGIIEVHFNPKEKVIKEIYLVA